MSLSIFDQKTACNAMHLLHWTKSDSVNDAIETSLNFVKDLNDILEHNDDYSFYYSIVEGNQRHFFPFDIEPVLESHSDYFQGSELQADLLSNKIDINVASLEDREHISKCINTLHQAIGIIFSGFQLAWAPDNSEGQIIPLDKAQEITIGPLQKKITPEYTRYPEYRRN